MPSHPVWVCGLKPFTIPGILYRYASHPVWVCGLKPLFYALGDANTTVTPCMGVWIETLPRIEEDWEEDVTPCMGVWIETKFMIFIIREVSRSHPVWVCGLKLSKT